MLWEEVVPLLREGYHKDLVNKAYGEFSQGKRVYPDRERVFDSMRITTFDSVRVVIIGQDPYFNEHPVLGPEAHGLSFSVKQGIPTPPSLKNIFLEIQESIYNEEKRKFSTDLTRWAQQGVLLLNASLTVIARSPNSHADLGWHKLTDNIIEIISEKKENVVFMLWGSFAQKKACIVDNKKHLLLKTSHPSPLSAYRGFLGSGVFRKCNEYLLENGFTQIIW